MPRAMGVVVHRALIDEAAKGNAFAAREVVRLNRELEERDQMRRQMAEEKVQQEYELGRNFKQRRIREWQEAQARGVEPSKPWLHPDDILLYPKSMTWEVRGPYFDHEVPHYEYYRFERDACFWAMMEQMIDPRGAKSLTEIWLSMACSFDHFLPKRWQCGCTIADKMEEHIFMEARQVTEKLDQARLVAEERRVALGIVHDPEVTKETEKMAMSLLLRHGCKTLAELDQLVEKEEAKKRPHLRRVRRGQGNGLLPSSV